MTTKNELVQQRIRDTLLLDTYGSLLTEKQRLACEMKWFEDCSLSEIAAELSVSRQGVQDLISRARENLEEYNAKLSLLEQQSKLKKIEKLLEENKDKIPDDLYTEFARLFEE